MASVAAPSGCRSRAVAVAQIIASAVCCAKCQRAFKEAYGKDDVRFTHTYTKGRVGPKISECSMITMPELCVPVRRMWQRVWV